MSTGIFIDKECFVCHSTSKYPEVGMMNLGAPEYLDGRPADSHSSVLYMFVQQCPACGYSAPDISNGNERIKALAESESYRLQAKNQNFPLTANKYICWAMFQEDIERYNEAGLALLYASWVCDDDGGSTEQSHICRSAALEYFNRAREEGQQFGDSIDEEDLIVVDLLRRNGDFVNATQICKALLQKELNEKNRLVTLLQEDLIEEGDTKRHRISEALEN